MKVHGATEPAAQIVTNDPGPVVLMTLERVEKKGMTKVFCT